MRLNFRQKKAADQPTSEADNRKYNREASALSTTSTNSTASCHFGSAGGILLTDTTRKYHRSKSTGGIEYYRQQSQGSLSASNHFGAGVPHPKPADEKLDKKESDNKKKEPKSLADYQEMSRTNKTKHSMNFGSQMVL